MAETDLSRIPAFPPVAAKLLHLLANGDAGVESMVETLRADPELSGQILQRANSPEIGLQSQASSLQQALTVLGAPRARKMVVTVATGSYLGVTSRFEELRRCWRHTLATAFLAEELAWACALHEGRAFTAGLLHDIGRLALFAAHPKQYAELLHVAAENAYDVLECEIEQFGMDHCEAGRQLVERWNLPLEIGVIAGRHHDTAPSDSLDLLTLVHLGCRLADSLGYEAVKAARPST
ncbi:MAG: HDOD domain-containing protein, partial [Bryobacteraceae bacterium]